MDFPSFSEFLAQLDMREVDALARPMVPDASNTIIFPADSLPDLAKAVEASCARTDALAWARSLALLNLYHDWLDRQVCND